MGQFHHQNYHNNRHDIPPGMSTDQQDYYGIPYTGLPRVHTDRSQQYQQDNKQDSQQHHEQQVSPSGVFAIHGGRQSAAHVSTLMINDGHSNTSWQSSDNYSNEIKYEPAPYVTTTGTILCQDQGQQQQVMAAQDSYDYYNDQLYEQSTGSELATPSPATSYFQVDHCQDIVGPMTDYSDRSSLQTADYYENTPMTSQSKQQEVVQYISQERAIGSGEQSGDVVTSDLQYNIGFAPESLSLRQVAVEQTNQRFNPSDYVSHQNVPLAREHHHHQQQQQQQQPNKNSQIFHPHDECVYAQYQQKSHAQVNLSDKIADRCKPAGLNNPTIGDGMESLMTESGSIQSPSRSPQFYYVTHHPHHAALDHHEQVAAPSSNSIVSSRISPPVHSGQNDLNNAYRNQLYAPQSSSQSTSSVAVPTSTQVTVPFLPVSHSNETLPHSWHSVSVGVSNNLENSDSNSDFDNFYSNFGMCVKNAQSISPTITEAATPDTTAVLGESNRSQYVMSQFANNRTDTSSQQQKQQQQLQNKQIDKDHMSSTSASLSANRVLYSRSITGQRQQQQEYLEMGNSGTVSQDWLDTICRYLIGHMNNFGICVIDNFLGSIKGERILGEVQQLYTKRQHSKGKLVSNKLSGKSGGNSGANPTNEQHQNNNDCPLANYNSNNDNALLGNNKSNSQQQPVADAAAGTIRNDRVIWVDGCEDSCTEINDLIQTFCSVVTNSSRLSLYSNKGLDKVIINKRTKAHVACYPGNGTKYIKHVDNPNGDGRVITAIYYLNKNWNTKIDGGLLRMFPAGMDEVANIEPLFDRALFFWSDRRNPHEVLPAYRDRFAITVWFIGESRP